MTKFTSTFLLLMTLISSIEASENYDKWWDNWLEAHQKQKTLTMTQYVHDLSGKDIKAATWFLTTGGKTGFAKRKATWLENQLILETIDQITDSLLIAKSEKKISISHFLNPFKEKTKNIHITMIDESLTDKGYISENSKEDKKNQIWNINKKLEKNIWQAYQNVNNKYWNDYYHAKEYCLKKYDLHTKSCTRGTSIWYDANQDLDESYYKNNPLSFEEVEKYKILANNFEQYIFNPRIMKYREKCISLVRRILSTEINDIPKIVIEENKNQNFIQYSEKAKDSEKPTNIPNLDDFVNTTLEHIEKKYVRIPYPNLISSIFDSIKVLYDTNIEDIQEIALEEAYRLIQKTIVNLDNYYLTEIEIYRTRGLPIDNLSNFELAVKKFIKIFANNKEDSTHKIRVQMYEQIESYLDQSKCNPESLKIYNDGLLKLKFDFGLDI